MRCSVSADLGWDNLRPPGLWLPEDGIVDPIAIGIAATGARRVALTHTERLLAAARILAAGHHHIEISRRLHVATAC